MWNLRLFLLHTLLCVCLKNLTNCIDLNLTAQEEIELHSVFKRYNKPAVTEIKTIHGDVYKCVDFYKQPAFDNPLLKNHSYHQEMDISQLHRQASNVSQESVFQSLWVNGEGCPIGTIPMRKYTKAEFIRTQKLFEQLYPTDNPIPGTYRSSVHTKDQPLTFYGASAYLNVYNYPVDRLQYSGSYTLVRAVNDQLQFGWMINPLLYGDGRSRSFVTTTVEHSKCFNLRCGDYVHTNRGIPIDSVLSPTALRGSFEGTPELKAAIIRDKVSNKWQLFGANNLLGFWPNEVLRGLNGPATYLEWGGEAYNPPNKGLKGPPMGSGFFPAGQPRYDGYARQISKYDQNGAKIDVNNKETESYADDSNLYKIQDVGYYNKDYGHLAFFGGPGRK